MKRVVLTTAANGRAEVSAIYAANLLPSTVAAFRVGGANRCTTTRVGALESEMNAATVAGIWCIVATEVVTANPGCLMQVRASLRRNSSAARVRHIADLLDEAYGGAKTKRATIGKPRE